MLYNPRWNQVPNLVGFVNWLRMQDQEETYQWFAQPTCPVGRYAASIGMTESWLNRINRDDGFWLIWQRLNALAQVNPWQFGALLDRTTQFNLSGY